MMNRRVKRSAEPMQALQCLVEAVAERSRVSTVAVIDGAGRILAGTGLDEDLKDLADVAGPTTRGEAWPDFERATRGTDVLARRIPTTRVLYLAAFGSSVRRMPDAARAIA